jgi:acyl-CoA synthetase (AMP-forming)/AMP-acid ligase II
MLVNGRGLGRPAPPLGDLLRAGLEAGPEEVAVVSAEEAITWRDLERRSSGLAASYLRRGLGPGNRIASLMPNRIALLVHYLACFKAGLVATPLNYRYTSREIDHALEVSGAAAILVHTERADDIAASGLAGDLAGGTIWFGAEPGGGAVGLEELIGTEGSPEPSRSRTELPRPRSSSPRAAPGPRRASPTPTSPCAGCWRAPRPHSS